MVTLPPSIEEEEIKVVASESLICYSSHHSDSVFGVCGPPWFFLFWVFLVNILCPSNSCFVLSISVCAYSSRSLHMHIYTSQLVVAGYYPNTSFTAIKLSRIPQKIIMMSTPLKAYFHVSTLATSSNASTHAKKNLTPQS